MEDSLVTAEGDHVAGRRRALRVDEVDAERERSPAAAPAIGKRMVQGFRRRRADQRVARAGLDIRPILGRVAAADLEDERLSPEPGGELP